MNLYAPDLTEGRAIPAAVDTAIIEGLDWLAMHEIKTAWSLSTSEARAVVERRRFALTRKGPHIVPLIHAGDV